MPLFPLNQPLFPGVRLDLQIFEQRYIKLVRGAMREDCGFGICTIHKGGEVGTTPSVYDCGAEVKIVDWNQLPNGLLGITVEADRRFYIGKKEVDPDRLLSSEVGYFAAEIDEDVPEWASGLAQIYEELRLHPVVARRLPVIDQVRASGLGFGLAQILPMSKHLCMACFETTRPFERLELLVQHIETLANSGVG